MKIVVLCPRSFYCFNKKCIDFEWYREEPAHYPAVYHIFIHESSGIQLLWFIKVGARKLAKDYKLAMKETPICILQPHEI